jgi:hypothetical protein
MTRRGPLVGLRTAVTFLSVILTVATGYCWDSRTHQLITRLAISALPDDALRNAYQDHSRELQEHAVEPDTVLKPRYGEREARRHYIDLEYFGGAPVSRLKLDSAAMHPRYGSRRLDHAGTLPWAIAAEANAVESAWRSRDCSSMLSHAGYLAHYVGDASQPLHTTKYYDGPSEADRGMHARLEWAVDSQVDEIGRLAAGHASERKIDEVWPLIIDELNRSNQEIPEVVSADRAARSSADNSYAFAAALLAQERDLIVKQIDDAAGVLASIWQFEWNRAGAPVACD